MAISLNVNDGGLQTPRNNFMGVFILVWSHVLETVIFAVKFSGEGHGTSLLPVVPPLAPMVQ